MGQQQQLDNPSERQHIVKRRPASYEIMLEYLDKIGAVLRLYREAMSAYSPQSKILLDHSIGLLVCCDLEFKLGIYRKQDLIIITTERVHCHSY